MIFFTYELGQYFGIWYFKLILIFPEWWAKSENTGHYTYEWFKSICKTKFYSKAPFEQELVPYFTDIWKFLCTVQISQQVLPSAAQVPVKLDWVSYIITVELPPPPPNRHRQSIRKHTFRLCRKLKFSIEGVFNLISLMMFSNTMKLVQ